MSVIAEDIEDILMTSKDDISSAARSMKAMAHPLRLQILCILGATDETSVQQLVDRVGTSQSNISQHLSILRDKGILNTRKDANKVFYSIADPKVVKLICSLREAFCPTDV